MQNVEFKAELRDVDAASRQCRSLDATLIGTLNQTDTYFRLTDGRLKRREAPGEPTEWIFYHRDDTVQPTLSRFTILTEEQAQRRWGTHSLREWLTVVKRRELWMIDSVRIHLDEVYRLGQFIEFEAKISEESPRPVASKKVVQLREAFAPILGEPVAVSYCDLMAQLLAEEDDAA